MTVLECVKAAAVEVGLKEDVFGYLENGEKKGEEATSNLVRCFNLVENELALDYLPLFFEDELESETGAVYFSELTKAPVRIIKVTDGFGQELTFSLFPEYLKTQAGKIKVRYSYSPTEKGIEVTSDFLLYASVRLFAYGMAAEYFAASGLFEEAAVWDRKYKDAIQAAYKRKPNKKICSRRWL